MVGFYAKKNETRNETFQRLYGTDCPIKQASVKRQERARALHKTNNYKREVELATISREKKTYKHKSLNDLINRFKIKN